MRNIELSVGSYYHLFNRGVDKRLVFLDQDDIGRFLLSMNLFNSTIPLGSIYQSNLVKKKEERGHLVSKPVERLVEFICYCLNPNHYHFLIQQLADKGIEKFMHKLGNGYTKYFNHKYKRTGSLFGGNYKSVLIKSNEQLLHTSAYINLNNRISEKGSIFDLSKSSWGEYISNQDGICNKDIILEQFTDSQVYKSFAESSYIDIQERKILRKELEIWGVDT
ncbi:transposase [Candidatus Parcubacteria bacterium]|nr:transposase [Candidatus Parcubacteria bacterium]